MMATFLFFKSHSNIALILSMIGINVKYQYAAILIPILLADRKKFIKFLVVDCLALIPFGAISYVYTKDFLLLSHWTKGLGLPSLTNAFPTDLMLLYLTTISLIASLKDKKLSVYLALILANLFMITLVSPSKFAYKVTLSSMLCCWNNSFRKLP
jgi:hypothetical protein